jgi:hypothetical protein
LRDNSNDYRTIIDGKISTLNGESDFRHFVGDVFERRPEPFVVGVTEDVSADATEFFSYQAAFFPKFNHWTQP